MTKSRLGKKVLLEIIDSVNDPIVLRAITRAINYFRDIENMMSECRSEETKE